MERGEMEMGESGASSSARRTAREVLAAALWAVCTLAFCGSAERKSLASRFRFDPLLCARARVVCVPTSSL